MHDPTPSKRQKLQNKTNNIDDGNSVNKRRMVVGSALRKPGPEFDKGIKYWEEIEASVDGVLGGFGNGPVPHIDQLTSRLLLLSLLPQLQSFPSPLTPFPPQGHSAHRRTALDVGAGIGRVTNHVLLPLFDDVVLVEPVTKFVQAAVSSAKSGEWRDLPLSSSSSASTSASASASASSSSSSSHSRRGKGNEIDAETKKEMDREMRRRVDEGRRQGRGKRVWFVKDGLQFLDPSFPVQGKGAESFGVLGERGRNVSGEVDGGMEVAEVGQQLKEQEEEGDDTFGDEDGEMVYDVIWCQWCLGHLSTPDLLLFLARSKKALRQNTTPDSPAYIFVKENVCDNAPDGKGTEFLDEEDSSLTRSNLKWLDIFHQAGLEIVKEQVQEGLPDELFLVKTWALR